LPAVGISFVKLTGLKPATRKLVELSIRDICLFEEFLPCENLAANSHHTHKTGERPMDDLTRRGALALAAAAGAAAWAATPATAADDKEKPRARMTDRERALDRERVLACGLTEAEADCWDLVAQAAGKFFELPKLHVMDEHEVAHAIHVIQYRLLSRPAYRRYLELAKAPKK
jgi:hypothetical protein